MAVKKRRTRMLERSASSKELAAVIGAMGIMAGQAFPAVAGMGAPCARIVATCAHLPLFRLVAVRAAGGHRA